mmetsp:Transcript_18210/g.44702  ORF Transcript_18210/g.44702 Transcript_18210/m.44702 type:complete len:82 (+) Transcript_18210:1251-1496(+)
MGGMVYILFTHLFDNMSSIVYGATPKDLFSKVSSQAMERLDVVFKKSFLGSTEHEQYKNMVTLPESLVKLAKEQACSPCKI